MKILTVKKLIEHLQTNFKPDDKLCFWYEGGAYMNCEHVLKEQLGDTMFIYVSQDKERSKKLYPKDDIYEDCHWIKDNDVIIS